MSKNDLPRFGQWRPTQWDAAGLGSDDRRDWIVLPTIQTRDSDCLERANFEAAQKRLRSARVVYDVERFRHWGPGWVEILILKPTAAGLRVASEIAAALENYPILDEDLLAQLELEEGSCF